MVLQSRWKQSSSEMSENKRDKWMAVFRYQQWAVSNTFRLISWRLYTFYILSPLCCCFAMQLRCQAAQFSLSSSCFQAALLGAWQERIWCWNNPLHLILHAVPFVVSENFTVLPNCMFSPKDIKRNVTPASICITVKKPFLNSAGTILMPTLQTWQPQRVLYSNQGSSGFNCEV